MRLAFTKMQGLGNDFVVVDATAKPFEITSAQVRWIADRKFGIGCDQLLAVEAGRNPDSDFFYRIYNADGGEVEQCGNGVRCAARFAHDQGLTNKREIRMQTQAGMLVPRLEADGSVTVDMGEPAFEPGDIPFIAEKRALTYALQVGELMVEISALALGNPHAVQVVSDVDAAPVEIEGPLIEGHDRFPRRANAGYVQIVDRSHIRLRVYERGAGETLACGSGACAAVAAGIARGLLDRSVEVATRGGDLKIDWDGEGRPVLMNGPAVTVFTGEIDLGKD